MLAALLPDRWGLAAAASSIDLRGINADISQGRGRAVEHTSGQWILDLTVLGVLSAVSTHWRSGGCSAAPSGKGPASHQAAPSLVRARDQLPRALGRYLGRPRIPTERSRISTLRTLPVTVIGNSSVTCT